MDEILSKNNLPLFKGISCDSRKVKPGYAFVAITGFKEDGNKYIDEAIARGAVAIFTEKKIDKKSSVPIIRVKDSRKILGQLAAEFYAYPSRKLKLIGVTGTNGKTTTTHLIYHLLNFQKQQAGLIGTVQVDTGDEVKAGDLTTPPPVELQSHLRRMVDNHLKYACMEVSSHGIKLKRIAGTNFQVKVGTNISIDHFDLHPNFQDYLEVKKSFLQDKQSELVLINQDDPYLKSFGRIAKNQYNYSLNAKADIQASNIQTLDLRSRFDYMLNKALPHKQGKKMSFPIETKLLGQHNIYNALVATTIALYFGVKPSFIQEFFKNFNGVWRRLQIIYQKDFIIIDDCAHNPGSYAAVFKAIRNIKYKRLLVVNSLRGNRGVEINQKNAETISKYLAGLEPYFLYTSNCKDVVKPIDYVSPAEEKVFLNTLKQKHISTKHYQELQPALEKVVLEARPGDLVLLLGPHAMDHAGEMILKLL